MSDFSFIEGFFKFLDEAFNDGRGSMSWEEQLLMEIGDGISRAIEDSNQKQFSHAAGLKKASHANNLSEKITFKMVGNDLVEQKGVNTEVTNFEPVKYSHPIENIYNGEIEVNEINELSSMEQLNTDIIEG